LTDSAREARLYAFRLLSYRARSEKEMTERLQRRGFSQGAIDVAVRQLKKDGYLDDSALAAQIVRQASDGKRLGRAGARALLFKRGVPDDIAGAALSHDRIYDRDAELKNAEYLVERKVMSLGGVVQLRDVRRLHHFLARRGYSPEIIRSVLKDLRVMEDSET
jgi:regulatory protein